MKKKELRLAIVFFGGVSVFLRSRWFKPPLDGKHLTGLIFDGLEAMEQSAMKHGRERAIKLFALTVQADHKLR